MCCFAQRKQEIERKKAGHKAAEKRLNDKDQNSIKLKYGEI